MIARSSAGPQAMSSAFESAVDGLYSDPDVLSANVVTGERLVRRSRSELVDLVDMVRDSRRRSPDARCSGHLRGRLDSW